MAGPGVGMKVASLAPSTNLLEERREAMAGVKERWKR